MADTEIQLLEQERLIEQLKSMIRERDEEMQKKDQELIDVNAKLSKLKLQAKAKQVKEAKDAKGGKLATKKEPSETAAAAEKETSEENQDRTGRAKSLLHKKKLEEKDRTIRDLEETVVLKDQQIEVKEKIIMEREQIISTLTHQLEDKTKLMEEMSSQGGGAGDTEAQVQQMYAQIVYKDKNLLELNNKILELERRLIDLQEFIGEKNEVIRGRDKVIQVLQYTIKDKDQIVIDQAMLVTKLTATVESNDEVLGHLREEVEIANHELKLERERFSLRLTESQKYFEETLKEQEENVSQMRKLVQDKEAELKVAENDLRETLTRHERDIQKIMSKGEVNIQDTVIQMLEQKMKDTNEVLEGKIKVIEMLQKECAQKDTELRESKELQRTFKDKLQQMSEQTMLLQTNLNDMESQCQEERRKHESKISELVEKHENECTEKDIQIQNLKSAADQLEGAYNQSLAQYSALQERYDQVIKPGGAVLAFNEDIKAPASGKAESDAGVIERLHEQLAEVESLKQRTESLTELLQVKEKEIEKYHQQLEDKEQELQKLQTGQEEQTTSSKGGDTKLLKVKAQLTAKVKNLEKELDQLRKGTQSSEEVETLKNELAAVCSEKEALQARLAELTELKEKKECLEQKVRDLEDHCSKLEGEKALLSDRLESVGREKDQLQQEITSLKLMQEENTSSQSAAQLERQNDLESKLEGQRSEVSRLQEELRETKDKLEQQTLLVEQLKDEKGQLEVKVVETEQQFLELERQRLTLEEEAENYRERMKKEFDELREQLQNSEAEKLGQFSRVSSLDEEITALRQQVTLAESSRIHEELLSEKEQIIDELKQQVYSLTTEVADKTHLLEEAENDQKAKHDQIEVLETKCKDMEEKVKKTLFTCDQLRQENEEERKSVLEFLSVLNAVDSLEIAKEVVAKLIGDKDKLENTCDTQRLQMEQTETQLNSVLAEVKSLSESKTELENRIREKELLVNQLTEETKLLKVTELTKGAEFETKTVSLLSQLQELEKAYSDMTKIKEQHESKLEELKAENNDLQMRLDEAYKNSEELKYEKDKVIQQLTEDFAALNKQLHDLKDSEEEKVSSLKEERELLAKTNIETNALFQSERKVFTEKVSELEKELVVLRQECQTEKEQRSVLEEKEHALQNEINALENLTAEKCSEVETLRLSEDALNQKCSQKHSVIQELQQKNGELNQRLSDKEQEISDLHKQCSKLENEISILQSNLKDKAEENEGLKAENVVFKSESEKILQDKEEEYLKMKEEVESYTNKCVKLEGQVLQLCSEIELLKQERDALKGDASEKDSAVERWAKDLQAANDRTAQLGESLVEAEKVNSELERKMKEFDATVKELSGKIDLLDQENKDLQEKRQTMSHELHVVSERNEKLSEKLSSVSQELQDKSDKLTEQKIEYDQTVQDHTSEIQDLVQKHDQAITMITEELTRLKESEKLQRDQYENELVQLQESQQQLKDLKQELDNLQSEKEKLLEAHTEELSNMKLQHTVEMEKLRQEMDAEVVGEQTKSDLIMSELDAVKEERSSLISKLEKEECSTQNQESELPDFDTEVRVSEEGLSDFEKIRSLLEGEIRELTKQNKNANKHIVELQTYAIQLEQECESLRGQMQQNAIVDDDLAVCNLKRQLDIALERVRDLNDQSVCLEANHTKLLQRLVGKEKEIEELKGQLLISETTCKSLENRTAALETEISEGAVENKRLEESFRESRGKLEELNTELNLTKSTNESLKDKIATLEKEIAEAKAERELEESSSKNQNELDVSYKRLEELTLKLEDRETDCIQKDNEITKLKSELEQFMKNCAVSEARISELGLALEEKEHEIRRLESDIDDLTNQSTLLKLQMETLSDKLEVESQVKKQLIPEEQEIQKIEVQTEMTQFASENINLNASRVEENEAESLEVTVAALQKELDTKDLIISELRNQENETLLNNDSDFKDYCDKLETDKRQLQWQLDSAQKLLKKKETKIKSLLKQLGNVTSDKTDELLLEIEQPQTVTVDSEHSLMQESLQEHIPSENSSLNSSHSSVISEKDSSFDIHDLSEKLRTVTEERNKYKADNKKLLKIGKGKDTKLKIMNENFEQLRTERDQLLADRDTLENKVQDLSTNFIQELESEKLVKLEIRVVELETLCKSKEEEIERLLRCNEEQSLSQAGNKSKVELNVLSKENEKLRAEVAKLQMIDKGKTAKISQVNHDFEIKLKNLNKELQDQLSRLKEYENELTEQKQINEELKTDKEKIHSDIGKLQKVTRGKEAKLRKLEEVLEEKDTEIAKKVDENSNLQSEIRKLNSVISDCLEKETQLKNEIGVMEQNAKHWDENFNSMSMKLKDLEQSLVEKETEIETLKASESVIKKLKEDKIILEFHLDCVKEELDKIKSSVDEDEMRLKESGENADYVQEKEEGVSESQCDKADGFETGAGGDTVEEKLVYSSSEGMVMKLAHFSHENKILAQEKLKLQKLIKGKEAKLKKIEEYVKEQQSIISNKETDILILEERIKDLNEKVYVLEDIEQDMHKKLDSAIADVDEWQDRCNELEDRLDAAEDAIDRKNDELFRLEDDLAANREEIENLCVERDEMERQRDLVTTELEEIKSLLQRKEEETTELQAEMKSVSFENEQFNAEIKKLQLLCKGKDAKLKRLEETFTSHESLLDENAAHVSNLQSQLQQVCQTLEEKEIARQNIESHLQEEVAVKTELEHHYHEVKEQAENLKLILQNKDVEILDIARNLQDFISTIEANMEKINSALEEKDAKLLGIERQMTVFTENSKTTLYGLREGLSKLDKELEEMKLVHSELQQKLIEKEGNLNQLNDISAAWENRCREFEIAYESNQNLLHEKELQLNSARDELQSVQEKLQIHEQITSEYDTKQKANEMLQTNMDNMNEKLVNTERKILDLEQELHTKEALIQPLKDKCTALEKQFKENLNMMQTKDETVQSLRKKCSQLENQNSEVQEKLTLKESELNRVLENTKYSAEESQHKYNSELERLQDICQEKERECNELQSKLDEMSLSVETQVQKLKTDLDEKKEELSHLKQQLEDSKATVEAYEKHAEQINSQLEQLYNEKSAAEQQLGWFNQYYSDTQSRVPVLEEEVMNLQIELNKKEELLASNQQCLSEFEKMTLEAQNREQKLEEENKRLSLSLKERDSEILQLGEELTGMTKTESDLRKQILMLQESVSETKISFEETKHELEEKLLDATECNHKLRTEMEDIKLQLVSSKDSKTSVVQELPEIDEVVSKSFVEKQGTAANIAAGIERDQREAENLSVVEMQIIPESVDEKPADSSACAASDLSAEIKKLKKLCKGKDAKIKKLEEKLKFPLKADSDDMEKSTEFENSDLKQKIEQLEKVLIETQHDRERHISEVDELKSMVMTLQIELKSAKDTLSRSVDEHNHKTEELMSDLTSAQNELVQSKNDCEEVKSTLEDYRTAYDSLQIQSAETVSQLKLSVSTLQEEVDTVSKQLSEVTEKYKLLLHQNSEHENIAKTKDEELTDLKHMLKDKMVELSDAKKTVEALQQSGEGTEAEKHRFEELLKNEREEIQSLYEQMNQLVSEKLDMEVNLEQKERDLRIAADELRKFAADRDRLDDLIEAKESLQVEVDTLKRDLSEIRKRQKEKENYCKQLETEADEKEHEKALLRQELDQVKASLRSMDETLSNLQERVDTAEESAQVLSRELESKKEACTKLKGMCEEKNELIQSLKETTSEFSEELSTSKKQNAELQEEIALYKEQLHAQKLADEQTYSEKVAAIEIERNKLQEESGKLKQSYAVLESSYKQLEINEREALTEKQKEIDCLTESVSEMAARVKDLENSCRSREEKQTAGEMNTDSSRKRATKEVNTEPLKDITKSAVDQKSLGGVADEVDSNQGSELMSLQDELEKTKAVNSAFSAKLKELEHKLGQKDEKIAFLLENMQEMEERLTQLTSDDILHGTNSESGIKEADLDSVSKSVAEKEAEIKELETKIDTLQRLVEEKEFKFTKALATAKKIKAQLNQSRGDFDKEKREKESLEKLLEEMKNKAENKSFDDSVLNSTVVAQEHSPGQMLAFSADSKENEKDQLTQKHIQDLQSQCQTYAEFSQQLQEQVQSLTEAYHSSEKKMKTVEETLELLNSEKEKLLISVKEKDEFLNQLGHEADNLRQSLKNQVAIFEEKSQMNAVLENEVRTLNEAVTDLSSKKKLSAQEMANMSTKLQELEAFVESLQAQLQDKNSSLEKSGEQFNELLHQNKSYEETIQMLQAEIKSKTEEQDQSRNVLEQMSAEQKLSMTSLQEELDITRKRKEELESDLDETRESLAFKGKDLLDREQKLKAESDTIANEVTSLRTVLNEKDQKLDQLEYMLENQLEVNKEKEAKIADLEKEMKELHNALEYLQKESSLKQEEISKINGLLTALESDKEERDSLINSLQASLHESAKELEQLNVTLIQKENELSDIHEKLSVLTKDKTEFTKKLQEIEDLKNQVELKDGLISAKEKELENSKDKIMEISARLEEITGVTEKLEKENENLQKEIDSDRVSTAEVLVNVSVLKGALTVKGDEIENLTKKCSDIQEALKLKESLINNMQKERENFVAALKSKELEIQYIQSQVESLGAVEKSSDTSALLRSLQMQVSELSSANNELSLSSLSLKEALESVQTEKQNLFEDLSALQDENDTLRIAMENLKAEKNVSENTKLSELSVRLVSLSEENVILQDSIQEAKLENKDLNEMLTALRNEVNVTQEDMTSLRMDYNELKEANEHLREKLREQNIPTEEYMHANISPVTQQNTQALMAERINDWAETGVVREEMQREAAPVQFIAQATPVQPDQEEIVSESDYLHQVIAEIRIQLESITTEKEELLKQINEITKERNSLKEKNETLKIEAEKKGSELRAFQERYDNDQITIAEVTARLSSGERTEKLEIEHLKHKCYLLENQVADTEKKLFEEVNASQELSTEKKLLEKQLKEFNKKVQDLEALLDNEMSKNSELQRDIDQAKQTSEQKFSKLKFDNIQTQNRNMELLEQIDLLQTSLDQSNDQIESMAAEKKVLQEQLNNLMSQVSDSNTRFSSQEQKVLSLTQKLQESDLILNELKQSQQIAEQKVASLNEQYQMLEKDNENYQSLLKKADLVNSEIKQENVKQKMKVEKLEAEVKESGSLSESLQELQKQLDKIETEKECLQTEIDGLREELTVTKKEKTEAVADVVALKENLISLKTGLEGKANEIESLHWRLDEAVDLEKELEAERQEKEQLVKNQKDIENELLKAKASVEELTAETKRLKDKINVLESENENWNKVTAELKDSQSELQQKDADIDELKSVVEEQQSAAVERISTLNAKVKTLTSELEKSKLDNDGLKKQLDKANKQLQKFDVLKQEYESLNEEHNRVITDNSGLAKQIEELHAKLKDQFSNAQNADDAEIDHLQKSKTVLAKRVEQLEVECSTLRTKCSELTEAKTRLENTMQQIEFERDTLKAYQKSLSDSEGKSASFHGDYTKLQQQFNVAMQQKNRLQTELNMAQRSLGQREARCQQLASQMSQLAEDRSFLNVQLGSLSKSLREKEQEVAYVQQQYRNLRQTYTDLQAKIADLEKRSIMELIQRSPAPSSGSVTPVEGQPSRSHDLRKKLEASINEQQKLRQTNAELQQKTQEYEHVLEITLKDRLGEAELRELENAANDEAVGRVSGLELLRDANSSYLSRFQRWMSLQTAMPPTHVERPVQ